jgi:DNA anti-recombination protein RmuC
MGFRTLAIEKNTIDQTSVRTRAMERKLREVEQLPVDASEKLLGLSDDKSVEVANEEAESYS